MSGITVVIINFLSLIILGTILFILYKSRDKKVSTKNMLEDLKVAFATQDKVIYHATYALLANAKLCYTISDMITKGIFAIKDVNPVALAGIFKEVAYRIEEQIGIDVEKSRQYVFLNNKCFTDTKNCLLVLNQVLIEVNNNTNVMNIVNRFSNNLNHE